MKCELCFDNDCLDLPSLTEIKGNRCGTHAGMGYVILESKINLHFLTLRYSKSQEKY